MFLPTTSGRAELVEVIRLDGTDGGRPVVIWEAGHARSALALMAGLPDGNIKRCFIPGWEIRAHSDTAFLFEIAFCFRCHGARLRGPTVPADQQVIHGFDSESTAGRELLARFRAADHG